MKKLLLLLAFAASASAAQAQARAGGNMASTDYTGGKTNDSRNTGFGVKAGYNLSTLRGSETPNVNRSLRNDFHAGVFGQMGFSSFSSLQVELLYSRQGFFANNSGPVTPTNNGNSYRLAYLALPIMYVGNVTESISFHIGPQISLLTQAQIDDKVVDLKENGINFLDYGGVAGAEARIGPARLGARYNLNFNQIFDSPKGVLVNPALAKTDIYNSTVQVYVGIGFTQ